MAEIELSNYDIHKQLYATKPALEGDKLKSALTSVGAWFSTAPKVNYYMLLCHEKRDYTVLHFKNMNYAKGIEELEEILKTRGDIIDIYYEHTMNAYQCWVRSPGEDDKPEVSMYYLFDYEWGIVEVE